jgi:hypothetical protein
MKKFQIEQARRMASLGLTTQQIAQVLSAGSEIISVSDVESLDLEPSEKSLFNRATEGDVNAIIEFEESQR